MQNRGMHNSTSVTYGCLAYLWKEIESLIDVEESFCTLVVLPQTLGKLWRCKAAHTTIFDPKNGLSKAICDSSV